VAITYIIISLGRREVAHTAGHRAYGSSIIERY